MLTHSVDSRVGDLADPRSLDDAFESVHTLLLCSGHEPTMAELQLNVLARDERQLGITAAVAAGRA